MAIRIICSVAFLGTAIGCSYTTNSPSDCAPTSGTDGGVDPVGGNGNGGSGTGGPGGKNGAGGGTAGGGTSGVSGGGTSGVNGGGGKGGAPPTGEWKSVTSNLTDMPSECGNLSFLSAKPDEDLLITGVAQKGLWSSKDGGTSWQALGSGSGSAVITNRLTWIEYDPEDSNQFWEAGIYNSGGVYQTTDDGTTFTGLGDATHIDQVSVDFTDPARKVLLAGKHETAQQLLRSEDGGGTWQNVGAGLPAGANCTFPFVIDAQTHLVGCWGGTSGIYRSTDAGKSWDSVTTGGGYRPVLRTSDKSLYWASSNNAGMVRSTNDGETWTEVIGGGAIQSVTPVELPDGRIATLSASTVVASSDQGATWQPVSVQLPYGDSVGLVYSAQQKAFFVWHFTCGSTGSFPVPADAIMRYDFDYTKG